MGEPGASLVRQQMPSAPILADFTNPESLMSLLGTKAYPGNALFTTAPWIRMNASTIHRLTRAISRATQWARSQTAAEIVRRLPRELQSGNGVVMEQAIGNMLPHMSLTGRMSPEAAEAVARLMGIQGRIAQSYTNDFAITLSR